MEQNQLQQIFERYLADQATRDEVRLLLQHFGTDDKEQLSALILASYHNHIETKGTQEQDAVIARVKSNLSRVITKENKVRNKTKIRNIWIALAVASLIIFAILLVLFYPPVMIRQSDQVQNITIITKKGQRKTITLSDGTRIWLSPASTLTYPGRFSDTTRNVQLNGEAFFDVARDKEHPFIVQSGKLNTRVLGTTFNVHAYKEDDNERVTLLTGKVLLSASGNEQYKTSLIPYQQADYNKRTGNITRSAALDAILMLDRRAGIYHYRGVPVLAIIADLVRDYNIQVDLKGDFTNCTFYGDFKDGEDPILLLRKICVVINAQFTHDENGITIIGKGCINP